MATTKRPLRDTDCECADPVCPIHVGVSTCSRPARGGLTVFRIDMEDVTGTRMCCGCADDAMDSGLFRGGRG